MALTFNGKVFRNLQEQVQYITLWLSANALANEMGIKTLGRVDSEADLPANDPDHPFEYGDAYMVGEEGETPYRMSIWTRDAGDGNPGWFDIGYFPTAPDQFSLVEINGQVVHIFNADTKLDIATAATTFRQLYSKKENGSQEMVDVSTSASPYCIVWRVDQSQINMPNQVTYPPSDDQAISKRYAVENFLAKLISGSAYPRIYGTTTKGAQTMYNVDASALANGIPIRDANGQLNLPSQADYTPGANQAISRSYADAHYASGVTHYIHRIIVDVTTTSNYKFKMLVSIINSSNTAITSFGGIFSDSNVLSLSVAPMEAEDDEYNDIFWSVSPYYGDGFAYSSRGLGVSITPSIGAPFIIDGLSSAGSSVSTISIVDTVSQL